MKRIDIVGKKFNRLMTLKYIGQDSGGNARFLFRCDCGKEKIINGADVRKNRIKSCGCYRKENPSTTIHHISKTKFYSVWKNMKNRCLNKKVPAYKDYGGRGIKVCERWLESFMNFYNDMFDSYNEELEIDRIDNNGNYEPSNCRWATCKEQSLNRRSTIMVEINGEIKCVSAWARIKGLNRGTVSKRISKGWSPFKALTTPIKKV